MRLIDAEALIDRFKPEERYKYFRTDLSGLKNILEDAPTVEAIPVSKINEVMGKIERGLQACFNMVHCESNHDLLEGQERAFKYCIETLKEALNERKTES